jgi:hypothetical protein
MRKIHDNVSEIPRKNIQDEHDMNNNKIIFSCSY